MRRILFTAAVLLWATCASAQVTFDANATAPCSQAAVVGTTGLTCATLTVGSGVNRALVCAVVFSLHTPTSEVATWDSGGTNQAMALIQGVNGTGTIARAELWGLTAPTSGAKTFKITWVGTSDIYINCTSWTGADQTGSTTTFPHSTSSTGTTAGNPTAYSMAITSAVNNATMAATSTDTGSLSLPTQTQTFLSNALAADGAASRAAGAASVSHGWTVDTFPAHWVIVGTDIAVPSAAVSPPTRTLLGVGKAVHE